MTEPYDREPYSPSAYPHDPPAPPTTAAYVASPPPAPPIPSAPPSFSAAPPATPRALWADRAQMREWAFIGGMVGAVLILVGAFAVALFVTVMNLVDASDPDVWFLDEANFPGAPLAVALVGMLTGGLVLVGALRLKDGQDPSAIPGGAMLFGGILSFFALGGFLVGGLTAIVAGVMAISGARTVLPPRVPRVERRARPLP